MACNAEISTSTKHTISHKHRNNHKPISNSIQNPKPRTQDPNTSYISSSRTNFIGLGGLGCVSMTPVTAPQVIRTAADWEMRSKKKVRRRSKTGKRVVADRVGISADVCCGPGIGFATDAAFVDCVDSRRPVGPKTGHRQRFAASRLPMPFEDAPMLDYGDAFNSVQVRSEVSSVRQIHPMHRTPCGLSEIQMLESSLSFGRSFSANDQFGGWRLDVDSMSYEELLALGDRIGYVGTGLGEEVIHRYIRKTKHSMLESLPLLLSDSKDSGCSICQDVFEAEDEIGKLECNHFYHMHCIKHWLIQKNACPVCKVAAIKP